MQMCYRISLRLLITVKVGAFDHGLARPKDMNGHLAADVVRQPLLAVATDRKSSPASALHMRREKMRTVEISSSGDAFDASPEASSLVSQEEETMKLEAIVSRAEATLSDLEATAQLRAAAAGAATTAPPVSATSASAGSTAAVASAAAATTLVPQSTVANSSDAANSSVATVSPLPTKAGSGSALIFVPMIGVPFFIYAVITYCSNSCGRRASQQLGSDSQDSKRNFFRKGGPPVAASTLDSGADPHKPNGRAPRMSYRDRRSKSSDKVGAQLDEEDEKETNERSPSAGSSRTGRSSRHARTPRNGADTEAHF